MNFHYLINWRTPTYQYDDSYAYHLSFYIILYITHIIYKLYWYEVTTSTSTNTITSPILYLVFSFPFLAFQILSKSPKSRLFLWDINNQVQDIYFYSNIFFPTIQILVELTLSNAFFMIVNRKFLKNYKYFEVPRKWEVWVDHLYRIKRDKNSHKLEIYFGC